MLLPRFRAKLTELIDKAGMLKYIVVNVFVFLWLVTNVRKIVPATITAPPNFAGAKILGWNRFNSINVNPNWYDREMDAAIIVPQWEWWRHRKHLTTSKI